MKTSMILSLVLLLLAAGPVLRAAGAPETGTTTILIPTLYQGPGAHESIWWSYAAIDNESALPLTSPGVEFFVPCPPIPEPCERAEVPPGEGGAIASPWPADGLLLHVQAEVADDLAFKARFGQGEYGLDGTELPVVREHQFRRKPVRLPGVRLYVTPVPIRTTLRIYGIDAIPGTTVRVEAGFPGRPPHASGLVTLHVPPSPAGLPAPLYPAYAQLALQTEFPYDILLAAGANITIVPLPLPSGEIPRIWAFVSTISNVTNEVWIQQPQ
jgi:hypothetical protein